VCRVACLVLDSACQHRASLHIPYSLDGSFIGRAVRHEMPTLPSVSLARSRVASRDTLTYSSYQCLVCRTYPVGSRLRSPFNGTLPASRHRGRGRWVAIRQSQCSSCRSGQSQCHRACRHAETAGGERMSGSVARRYPFLYAHPSGATVVSYLHAKMKSSCPF
jgi:hypothetical protein